jgi:hypothetical protein
MYTHVPIIDRHTDSSGHIVIGRKKDRKKKCELDEPGTKSTYL